MFILIIARGYPQKSSPILGVFEYDQAKALCRAGHKVVFVSLDLRSIRRIRKLGKYTMLRDGLEIFNMSVPVGNVPAPLFYQIGKFALGKAYREILQRHGRPDIIHSHFPYISAIASSLKVNENLPFVVTEHSSYLNKEKLDKKSRYFGEIAYSRADKIICVSESLQKRLLQHFNARSIVINNIVDTAIFYPTPKKHEKCIFVSTGNLIKRKGFDVLIQAFGQLNHQNSELHIIGDGPEYKPLKKLIEQLDLSGSVKLMGVKSRHEINEILNGSDVFVLPSYGETFGVVLIEALAVGLPVVATACGGPEEYINKENGMLVPPGEADSLASAMRDVSDNLSRYDRQKISSRCKEKFSPEAIASLIDRVYQDLMNL